MKFTLISLSLFLAIVTASANVKPFIFLEAPLYITEHDGSKIKVLLSASSFVFEDNNIHSTIINYEIESSITRGNITYSRYCKLSNVEENIKITKNKEGLQKIIISDFLTFKNEGKSWALEYKVEGKVFVVKNIENEKIQFLYEKIVNIDKNKDNYEKLWKQLANLWMSEPVKEIEK